MARDADATWSARILGDQGWSVPLKALRHEGKRLSGVESWLSTRLEKAELADDERYRQANESGIMYSDYLYDPHRIPALEHLLRGIGWRPGQLVPGVNLTEWSKPDDYCRVELKDGKVSRVLLNLKGSSFAAPAATGRTLTGISGW